MSDVVEGSGDLCIGFMSLMDTIDVRTWPYIIWFSNTVRPACKVRGFVQEKLTIQEGFSALTLEQGNFIMFMPLWYYAKLTSHPEWK